MKTSKDDNYATFETNESTIYTYDEDTNALIAAETSTTKWVYTYDDRGNITEEKVYSISLDENNEKVYTLIENETDTFVYSGGWLDELSSYNGQSISYDLSGNPTSYLGNILTWTMGRQLASYGSNTYTYNEDGIRTSKTVNGEKTTYYLDGTNIIEQRTGTDVLHFHYDSNDEIIGFTYGENDYFYVKNSMGDITGITDINGNLVASYTYDVWGKVLDEELTAIGELNPFRYRGYYYDSDIQMYYLQSRYYDPEVGRFINSDDVSFIGATGSEISYNPFAYCENNPVNDSDYLGYVSIDSIISKLKTIFENISDNLSDYLKSFYSRNKKEKTITIGTHAIAIAVDAIVAMTTNALIISGVKKSMKWLLKNKSIRSKFVNKAFDFFLNNKCGKFVLWLICHVGLFIAGKPGLIGTVSSGVFKGYLNYIATFKSVVLQRSSSVVSVFTSIGGFVAFFADFIDKKWDSRLQIKY